LLAIDADDLKTSLPDCLVRSKLVDDKLRGSEEKTPVMTLLDKIKAIRLPFAELKGVTFIAAEQDRVVARMLVRPDLCTLGHVAHGGAIMALADSVGAAATVINLPEDAKGTTTLESKTNFIGAAAEGTTVVATATPVHRGRRTQVWQTRVETEEGKLVALVSQTQMVLV
jgi:1,4-dihydroxy-2-naphthoyl-CoA hydrolase